MEKQISKLVNGYLITEQILGEGLYSLVQLGLKENDLEQKVAVKIIKVIKIPKQNPTKFIKLLQREIDIMRKLSLGDGFVTIQDCFLTTNNLYMILKYCEGGDLSKLLKEKQFLLEEQALHYFKNVCKAFKVCYKYNIIHRDLKPTNILLTSDNQALVSDLGFSKVIEEAYMEEIVIQNFFGRTNHYMSPQILLGDCYSSKTDVWSLAIILYEMLYGFTPWGQNTPFNLAMAIKTKPLYFPEDKQVSSNTKDLLTKMLIYDDEKRASWQDVFNHPSVQI